MRKPTQDERIWMIHHPFSTVFCFLIELPFLIPIAATWLLEKVESKEQRRHRIKVMRTIEYYLIRMTR